MERFRTPDARFVDLPDFPWTAKYLELRDPTGGPDLRMAYYDEGPPDAAETIWLQHGEPSWSFLYRHMLPPLLAAGHRVVLLDLLGFGQSDKPAAGGDYTYARHVEWVREALFDHLDLSGVTFFGQDWGSLIGLRVVAENPEHFARVAIGNGFLPTGRGTISQAFLAWQNYSQSVAVLPVGRIVAGGCLEPLTPEEITAYDAPYPEESFKTGARTFPTLVPTTPDDPATAAQVAAWGVLARWTKPFWLCFSDGDQVTAGSEVELAARIPGTRGMPHVTIEGGGHFLQEDRGEQLATLFVEFIRQY